MKEYSTKTKSVVVTLFEFALSVLLKLKSRDANRVAEIKAQIAALNKELANVTKEYSDTQSKLTIGLIPFVEQWARENEGSYVGKNGRVKIVRPYLRRVWSADKMDEILEQNPYLLPVLQGAFSVTPVEIQVELQV